MYIFRNPNVGDHGQSSLTHWPEYNVTTQNYIRFQGGLDEFSVESHYVANRLYFWTDFVPTIYDKCDLDTCCDSNSEESDSQESESE